MLQMGFKPLASGIKSDHSNIGTTTTTANNAMS